MKKPAPGQQLYTQPESLRRDIAQAYRARAKERRWTDAERKAFARMAESWERTLPKKTE